MHLSHLIREFFNRFTYNGIVAFFPSLLCQTPIIRSQALQAGKKGVQLLLYKSPCFVFHYYDYCEHTVPKVHLLFKN